MRNLIFASTEKTFIAKNDRSIRSILENLNNYNNYNYIVLFWSSENIQKPQIRFPAHHLMNQRDNRDNNTGRVIPLFGATFIKHLAQANQKMFVSFSQITFFKILKQYFLTIKLSKIFLILSNV